MTEQQLSVFLAQYCLVTSFFASSVLFAVLESNRDRFSWLRWAKNVLIGIIVAGGAGYLILLSMFGLI